MKLTKKHFKRIMAVLGIIIVIEAAVLIFMNKGGIGKTAGVLSQTDAKVFVNNTEIPAYGYDGSVYIAADDLQEFGAEITQSPDGNFNMEYNSEAADGKDVNTDNFSSIKPGSKLIRPLYTLKIGNDIAECFESGKYKIINVNLLKSLPASVAFDRMENKYTCKLSASDNGQIIEGSSGQHLQKPSGGSGGYSFARGNSSSAGNTASAPSHSEPAKKIIVLDPGHGKSSGSMSSDEKSEYGWVQNSSGSWGEWRHWKTGSPLHDCEGSGCSGKAPANGSCWYPIGNGDRDIEPDINLQNCLSAKQYLEELGYEVRLTRTSNDQNPSITQRLKSCYPDSDTSRQPDAELFLCVHSNAGGGKGSAYIALEGEYDQGVGAAYADDGNKLGSMVNDKIVETTSLKRSGSGAINGLGALIAFCKSPVTCGYLEIGFFDNSDDLAILKAESDKIGKAIACGIDEYIKSKNQ